MSSNATAGKGGGAMAPAGPDMRRLQGDRAARVGMAFPMILDRGDAARVAAIDLQCVPYVGMRFEYGGTPWEVTHAEDHVRGWVAEPLPRREATLFSKPNARSSRRGDGRARGACSRA